jgi:hypothetical protein
MSQWHHWILHFSYNRPVRSAYQPPANSTFLSEQTILSEQTSTKRTGWLISEWRVQKQSILYEWRVRKQSIRIHWKLKTQYYFWYPTLKMYHRRWCLKNSINTVSCIDLSALNFWTEARCILQRPHEHPWSRLWRNNKAVQLQQQRWIMSQESWDRLEFETQWEPLIKIHT